MSPTQMKASLPPSGHAGLSVEDQARSMIHLLTEAGWPTEAELQLSNPHLCPNCVGPVDKPSSPYCSETCRDRAAFVRQFRAAVASGTILEAEKQIVFGERLWWLLGGGLPMRDSRIPESAKRQVIKRSQGRCEFCTREMTAIENFGSGCNRPLHLRAVCLNCSRAKPSGDAEFSQSPAAQEILTDICRRINAQVPLRPCDDPVNWDWRAFVALRK